MDEIDAEVAPQEIKPMQTVWIPMKGWSVHLIPEHPSKKSAISLDSIFAQNNSSSENTSDSQKRNLLLSPGGLPVLWGNVSTNKKGKEKEKTDEEKVYKKTVSSTETLTQSPSPLWGREKIDTVISFLYSEIKNNDIFKKHNGYKKANLSGDLRTRVQSEDREAGVSLQRVNNSLGLFIIISFLSLILSAILTLFRQLKIGNDGWREGWALGLGIVLSLLSLGVGLIILSLSWGKQELVIKEKRQKQLYDEYVNLMKRLIPIKNELLKKEYVINYITHNEKYMADREVNLGDDKGELDEIDIIEVLEGEKDFSIYARFVKVFKSNNNKNASSDNDKPGSVEQHERLLANNDKKSNNTEEMIDEIMNKAKTRWMVKKMVDKGDFDFIIASIEQNAATIASSENVKQRKRISKGMIAFFNNVKKADAEQIGLLRNYYKSKPEECKKAITKNGIAKSGITKKEEKEKKIDSDKIYKNLRLFVFPAIDELEKMKRRNIEEEKVSVVLTGKSLPDCSSGVCSDEESSGLMVSSTPSK